MWNVLAPWQLCQLQRLADSDPERAETALNTLWRTSPGLFEELAISAVDQEQLGVAEAAELLGCTGEQVVERIVAYRQRNVRHAIVIDGQNSIARLSEGRVTVWEVVREYRKLGSVERLTQSFPGLTEGELAAALRYAEAHPQEIEEQISRYENILGKKRAEYPFAR